MRDIQLRHFKEKFIGFGVLAHAFRGSEQDQLRVDLMYVSRDNTRQGIVSRILELLSDEAKKHGTKYLYISSTETRLAVTFYKANGSTLTIEIDTGLYEKEPMDIHMMKKI